GATVVADGADDGARPCQLLLGGVVLEFYRAGPAEAPAPGGPNHQHYAWDIEPAEFNGWAARAKEWGIRPLRVTAHAAIHGLSIFFDDPDGYHMELAAHYVNAADMDVAKQARAELIQELAAIPGDAHPVRRGGPPTPVGMMSHFTTSAPALAAATHFWIDFMGGELYTVGPAIPQLVLAGITVDLFAAVPPRAPV